MNALIARYGLFYPPRMLRGEHVWRFLREVREVEHLTPDEVGQRQWDRLRAALVRAASLPYYSRLFHELGFNPRRSTDAALNACHCSTSPRFARITERCVPATRTAWRSTSGSTGMPFVFEKDASAAAYMDAVMYHVYSWHGIKRSARRKLRFWGMPFARRARTIARLKDLLMNRIRCNAFRTSEVDLRRFYWRAKRFHPEYLYGYPSLIHDFARFVVERRLDWPLRLKAVIGTESCRSGAPRRHRAGIRNPIRQ